MPPNRSGGDPISTCFPNEITSNKNEECSPKLRDDLSTDRPFVADMWLKYVIPLRMFLDFTLPLYLSPLYWNTITTHGPVHIFTKAWSDEKFAIYNKDVPELVIAMFFTTVISNVMEAFIFLHYRKQISTNWRAVFVHHLVLVLMFFLLLNHGQYLVILQAAVGFHHVAIWPIMFFRDWKTTFNVPQKMVLVTWMVISYTSIHYIHLAVFWHAYGPEKAGQLVCWQLRYFVTFHSIYQFYYDYTVCRSIARGLNFSIKKKF